MPSHNDAWHRPKPKKISEARLIYYPDGSSEWLEVTEDLEPWENVKAGRDHSLEQRRVNAMIRGMKWLPKLERLRKQFPAASEWKLCQQLQDELWDEAEPDPKTGEKKTVPSLKTIYKATHPQPTDE